MELKAKVLVIEDNQKWSERLKKTLEENGFATVTARSEAEAIEFLFRDSFQFVTLDLQLNESTQMNEMFSGWKILKKINSFTPDKKVPAMIISGFTADGQIDNRVKAMQEYGVRYFMPKSQWDKSEFLDIIKGALQEIKT